MGALVMWRLSFGRICHLSHQYQYHELNCSHPRIYILYICIYIIIIISTLFLDLPKALLASVHGLITASNYVEGVRATIRVGGNHVGRCTLIGACFGAMVRKNIY